MFTAMLVVLSANSIEVLGSLPRFEILTFCGHVLRHLDIPLARAIVISPWLGGPGCALSCFGLLIFVVSFCRVGCWVVGCRNVGCRIVGCRIVGLSDVGLSGCFGNGFPRRLGEH